MSPSAVYSTPTDPSKSPVASIKGPALVVGSLSTAQHGQYQALISELESSRKVDKQLLDRLVDQGIYPSLRRRTFFLI